MQVIVPYELVSFTHSNCICLKKYTFATFIFILMA